ATMFCCPPAVSGTSRSNCADGPGCSASVVPLPGWLITRTTVATSWLPSTSTCTGSPAPIAVPGAGLVIEIPAAAALRAAPRALERRKSGQIDEGVVYPSRLGEKPDRVKLLEPRGSLS